MRIITAAFLVVLGALSLPPGALAAPPKGVSATLESMRAVVGKLEDSISRSSKPDPNVVSGVSRAKNELESGRLLAALYRLQSPFSDLAMRNYLDSKSTIRSLAQFELEWKNAGKEIAAENAGLSDSRLAELPSAVRALVEVNRAQSLAYYKSALLYGRETEVRNGLAYVGLAKGNLAFALWASSLSFAPAGRTDTRSPRSAIHELEGRLLQAYGHAGVASQPGWFENINSTLKSAGELDRDGKFDGALEQLLDAEFFFDLLSSKRSPAGDPAALREASAQALAKLDAAATDQSLGRMIWEIAQGNLAPERDGSVPPERLARARVALDEVLPRYFELREKGNPVPTAAAAGPAKVRITLVRWPYT